MAGLNINITGNDFLCQVGPPENLPPGLPGILIGRLQAIYSPTRAFRLFAQNDGNFVLQYVSTGDLPAGWPNNPLDASQVTWITYWAMNTAFTETGGPGPLGNTTLVMQTDGNLVVYDGDRAQGFVPQAAVFSSKSGPGNPGAYLRMQDDGNLVVYAQSGRALWASGTSVSEHR